MSKDFSLFNFDCAQFLDFDETNSQGSTRVEKSQDDWWFNFQHALH